MRIDMTKLILLNKPFDVLSQFTDETGRKTLKEFISVNNVYPAGRLDRDSEGLLLLTDSGALQHYISDPKYALEKTYWVQVENIPDEAALEKLRLGIALKEGVTRPAKATLIAPPYLWPRTPPIRERKAIPTQWLELKISEGKNRVVRRMTAAIGHPTLRLIRYAIGDWTLDNIESGTWQQVTAPDLSAVMIKSVADFDTKNNRHRSHLARQSLADGRRINQRQNDNKSTGGSSRIRRKPNRSGAM